MRRLLLPGLLVLCSVVVLATHHSAQAKFHATNADTAHSSTDSILCSWLAKQSVSDEIPSGTTFYFWTTEKDLDSVTNEQALLRHFGYRNLEEGLYQKMLSDKKWNRNPLAKLLRGSDFGRIQGAWPSYWSALDENIEFDPAKVQLVKVVLEDSALVVVVHPDRKKNNWEVFDTKGRIVLLPEALKHSHRIAAVYFSSEASIPFYFSDNFPDTRKDRQPSFTLRGYRSFILCNESMIKSWHHAVPGMQDQVNKDLAYLLLLHAWFANTPEHMLAAGKNGENTKAAWKSPDVTSAAQGCMKLMRYGNMSADTSFTRDVIDQLRGNWMKQVKPVEKFPSRGVK